VVGLARSGSAAALALGARGEEVIGVDAGEPSGIDALREAGVEVHVDEQGLALLGGARAVIKSPGVPRRAPVIAAALARGLPVMGELELAWRMLANEFIAVTGTNGKTTTVELIGHIHREAGLPVAVVGNVGTAACALVGSVGPDVTVVCETSSFQLEDTLAFAPEGAVLVNLTADHLDRHETFEAYLRAKLRLFAHQRNDDVAVAPLHLAIGDLGGCARRVLFGSGPGAVLSRRAGELWWRERPLLAVDELRLRGAHNVDNAMAAAAICLERGVDPEAVRGGLRSFAGVAHRLQEVARRDGVLYVNDSKATNLASTLVALEALDDGSVSDAPGAGGKPTPDAKRPTGRDAGRARGRSIHLILGGQGKGQDFTALRDAVRRSCRAVYLIGEDAPLIAGALAGIDVPVRACGDLARAVAEASAEAARGEVVLLSPACASFDQFADFEARGERFRQLAQG
jgi:UDP-N-acetylmuramoylalanine--D-glutamate ligase